jgi:hypothetical protein
MNENNPFPVFKRNYCYLQQNTGQQRHTPFDNCLPFTNGLIGNLKTLLVKFIAFTVDANAP